MSRGERIWKDVLLYLLDEGAASSSQIASHFKVSKQKGSNVVHNLKNKGFIHKVNGRQVGITENGKEELAKHFPSVVARMMGDLDPGINKQPDLPSVEDLLPEPVGGASLPKPTAVLSEDEDYWRDKFVQLAFKLAEKL